MRALSQADVDDLPVEHGFRLRGLETTRIEVFVDAAFAFAVTMLVISFDEIPGTFEEMVQALKNTPAFVVAVAQLVWIWQAHNTWSRRFGLEDAMTVFLSTVLLIIVLIYIYPLRIMAAGFFSWVSNGWLPDSFQLKSFAELRFMFLFLGVGFVALCMTFYAMNAYAARHRAALRLGEAECYHLDTIKLTWMTCALTGAFSIVLALTLPDAYIPWAGFGYAPMGVLLPWLERHRASHAPSP